MIGHWDYVSARTGQTVRNVEGLCRRAMERVGTVDLTPADYDEALAHLIAAAWILGETRYDAARHASLGAWLAGKLPLVHIDWRRSFYGRRGEKRPLGHLPTEEADEHNDVYAGGAEPGGPGDRRDDRGDDGGGLHEGRDRELLRAVEALVSGL